MEKPTAQEIEIKTSFNKYAAKVWGNKKGIPTLALHGWLDNAATFDRLAPLLPDLYLVALDFPGHGFSAHRPRGIKYHYLDYAEDVIKAVDALGWKRFNLLGHSLGAGVATIVAGAFPDRIEKLVLIEGLGPMTRDPKNSHQYLNRSITQMKKITDLKPPLYENIEEMVEIRSRVGDMSNESVRLLIERGVIELENGITWRSDPRLKIASPSYLTEEQVYSYLENIIAPTLLITAESGLLTDRAYLESRCAKVRSLKKTTLPGGHHLHLDHPEKIHGIISEFLK
ncbi:alpha/beta hydrolase [bacterium]|nr:alpha/beta hydrolase [bacterium]